MSKENLARDDHTFVCSKLIETRYLSFVKGQMLKSTHPKLILTLIVRKQNDETKYMLDTAAHVLPKQRFSPEVDSVDMINTVFSGSSTLSV